MKKLILSILVAGSMFGGMSVAQAEPGPNGNNEKGLCTAYFNGQKNGHDKDGDGRSNPGPFRELENDAEDDGSNENLEDEQQISDDVFEFCDEFGIMGNPEENGRFDCRENEERDGDPRDEDTDGEIECIDN